MLQVKFTDYGMEDEFNKNVIIFSCKQSGHISRDCPNPSSEGGGNYEGMKCYKCGVVGHRARECPTEDEQD